MGDAAFSQGYDFTGYMVLNGDWGKGKWLDGG
jgi:hypothetical protein